MKCFTQYVYIYILYGNCFENFEKLIFSFFSIYRKLKIGMTSVYTETSKSIPVFFRYIPKLQNPYRYFFGIYRNLKIHTDIFSVYTETSKTIPIFFGIYHTEKYRYFSVSVWYLCITTSP